MTMSNNAYKEAGVDIQAGNELVDRIKPAIKKTARSGMISNIGGFGAFFDPKAAGYNDPILVSATDGVGTKLKVAIDYGRHDTVGIDLVAMCVNDLIVQGAEPLFFLDYFACGKLEVEHAQAVIEGIAKGCEESGCALIGGETAEMPGMYDEGDYDLAGFAVGAVERGDELSGETIKAGDVILGLASSGLHSNGFSLVRRIVETTQGQDYDAPASFDSSQKLGNILLTPTKLYIQSLLPLLRADNKSGIKGIANITGGGLLENIPRIVPDGLNAHLDANSWNMPPIFKWLKDAGNLSDNDMALTLNCGIGIVVICDPADEASLIDALRASGEKVEKIGVITDDKNSNRVMIEHTEKNWG
ncbi:MAG: phosphoribosylformylglycinamidine cyclo-ligase [Pseudomonadota bacterium]